MKTENEVNLTNTNKKLSLLINNNLVEVDQGSTIIQAAKKAGIHISALCFHEKVKPHGACRLCLVEIEKKGRSRIVASCAYPVEDGLVVNTESIKVETIRKHLVELYMAMFPFNPEIKALSKMFFLNKQNVVHHIVT